MTEPLIDPKLATDPYVLTYVPEEELHAPRVVIDQPAAIGTRCTKDRLARLATEAIDTVCSARDGVYGKPSENLARTAALWSAYLGSEVTAGDVALMMALVKVSRLRNAPDSYDSLVDLIGYALCYEDCTAS